MYKIQYIPRYSQYNLLCNIYDQQVAGHVCIDHRKKTIYFSSRNEMDNNTSYQTDIIMMDNIDTVNAFLQIAREIVEKLFRKTSWSDIIKSIEDTAPQFNTFYNSFVFC